ncbi:oligopeptide/dipeptide ABC transporter ATP-binding protein [Ancylobacter oerskovii]|uniref:Oligopeptide/dipeptide ABC transporter ATP-binding protein n=1 Tax=Ancylobacter oerskovii TaxID=459519 RepID=A0ABW4Z0L1_9HYPH|nr:ABC transporter ATP-binding protein [Ancylobacter oerskovii]MBS7543815.1 ABC transporter ATP-binding protein [Ancylobacter oerskovii]
MSEPSSPPLLELERLSCHFPIRGLLGRRAGTLRAVDDVSLSLREGEALGIVGESGSGKSTLGKTLGGIHDPTDGVIRLAGEPIATQRSRRPLSVRARLQYVYQDSGASLDQRWTLRRSLHEPLVIHTDWSREHREAKVREIAGAVGLAEEHLDLYPHELSGGQQRRAGLARILVLGPQIVVFDEPTSGLDFSVQATVLALIRGIRRMFNLTYLMISHDLNVVGSMCDRLAVMYLGRIVEIGPTREVLGRPRHPYTRSLVDSLPRIGGPRVTDRLGMPGEPVFPADMHQGCGYRTRCPIGTLACTRIDPRLVIKEAHGVACLEWRP